MDLGMTVFTGYGMSETCPIISLSLPKPHMQDWDDDRKLDVITKTGTADPAGRDRGGRRGRTMPSRTTASPPARWCSGRPG
jgi:hypothetical protein